jgi:hypothetical protein
MIDNKADLNKLIREKTRARLLELAKPEGELLEYPDGRVYRGDKLVAEPPTEEESAWVKRRMRGSFKRWYEGIYFTQEQKQELGLTDENIGKVRG